VNFESLCFVAIKEINKLIRTEESVGWDHFEIAKKARWQRLYLYDRDFDEEVYLGISRAVL
jgi:hypothetical protein